MTRLVRRSLTAAIGLSLYATAAFPQSVQPAWTHGTTLNAFAGAARTESRTAPVIGTAIGWEITPFLAIEGSGAWLDRASERDAFAAALKVHAALPITRPVVPFVAAGIGLYRASFDPASGTIPEFYRRRMVANAAAPASLQVFTDPTFIAGGGIDVLVSRHVSIRPTVDATIVHRNSERYVVTIAAVHLAYHFENHP